MVELQIRDNRGNVIKYQLGEGRHLLGKSRFCDILLMDRFVSRRHAELLVAGNDVYLFDKNSTNGCWLERKRINNVIQLTFEQDVRMGALFLSIHPLLYQFAVRPGQACSVEDFCNIQSRQSSANILHLHQATRNKKEKRA